MKAHHKRIAVRSPFFVVLWSIIALVLHVKYGSLHLLAFPVFLGALVSFLIDQLAILLTTTHNDEPPKKQKKKNDVAERWHFIKIFLILTCIPSLIFSDGNPEELWNIIVVYTGLGVGIGMSVSYLTIPFPFLHLSPNKTSYNYTPKDPHGHGHHHH